MGVVALPKYQVNKTCASFVFAAAGVATATAIYWRTKPGVPSKSHCCSTQIKVAAGVTLKVFSVLPRAKLIEVSID